MHDLSENAKFFDRLVDLVPAKYYHPSDQELLNTKFLKNNAKAAAKQLMKEQYKQNKRAKLNPDTAKTSLQIQQQQVEELRDSDSSEEDVAAKPGQEHRPEPVRTLNLAAGGLSGCTYMRFCASTKHFVMFRWHTISHNFAGKAAAAFTGKSISAIRVRRVMPLHNTHTVMSTAQTLREQRHADEDTSKPNKGKRTKDKDQAKRKQIKPSVPKELGTAAAAKAWRHSQLGTDKGTKRYDFTYLSGWH